MNNILLLLNKTTSANTNFTTTWDASSGFISVPVRIGFSYNFNYRINGGAWINYTDTPTVNHELVISGLSGTATLEIEASSGGIPKFVFNNGGDKLKLLSIEQWGTYQWIGSALARSFYGCSNLSLNATDPIDLSFSTDLTMMFRNTGISGTLDWNNAISDINQNYTTTLMFSGCNLSTVNMVGFKAKTCDSMFSLCNNLTTLNIPDLIHSGSLTFVSGVLQGAVNKTIISDNWVTTGLNNNGFANFSLGRAIANYDNLLINLSNSNPANGVTFDGGTSKYTSGEVDKGVASQTTTNKLIDSQADFTNTCTVGDAVYNITDGSYARIAIIHSDTELTLDDDIFTRKEEYSIQLSGAAKAKAELDIDYNWTITDDGFETLRGDINTNAVLDGEIKSDALLEGEIKTSSTTTNYIQNTMRAVSGELKLDVSNLDSIELDRDIELDVGDSIIFNIELTNTLTSQDIVTNSNNNLSRIRLQSSFTVVHFSDFSSIFFTHLSNLVLNQNYLFELKKTATNDYELYIDNTLQSSQTYTGSSLFVVNNIGYDPINGGGFTGIISSFEYKNSVFNFDEAQNNTPIVYSDYIKNTMRGTSGELTFDYLKKDYVELDKDYVIENSGDYVEFVLTKQDYTTFQNRSYPLGSVGNTARVYVTNSTVRVDNGSNFKVFTGTTFVDGSTYKIRVQIVGTDLEVLVDNISLGLQDISGVSYTFNAIGTGNVVGNNFFEGSLDYVDINGAVFNFDEPQTNEPKVYSDYIENTVKATSSEIALDGSKSDNFQLNKPFSFDVGKYIEFESSTTAFGNAKRIVRGTITGGNFAISFHSTGIRIENINFATTNSLNTFYKIRINHVTAGNYEVIKDGISLGTINLGVTDWIITHLGRGVTSPSPYVSKHKYLDLNGEVYYDFNESNNKPYGFPT